MLCRAVFCIPQGTVRDFETIITEEQRLKFHNWLEADRTAEAQPEEAPAPPLSASSLGSSITSHGGAAAAVATANAAAATANASAIGTAANVARSGTHQSGLNVASGALMSGHPGDAHSSSVDLLNFYAETSPAEAKSQHFTQEWTDMDVLPVASREGQMSPRSSFRGGEGSMSAGEEGGVGEVAEGFSRGGTGWVRAKSDVSMDQSPF